MISWSNCSDGHPLLGLGSWAPTSLLGSKCGLSDSPRVAHYWFSCANDLDWHSPYDICLYGNRKYSKFIFILTSSNCQKPSLSLLPFQPLHSKQLEVKSISQNSHLLGRKLTRSANGKSFMLSFYLELKKIEITKLNIINHILFLIFNQFFRFWTFNRGKYSPVLLPTWK